MNHPSGAKGGWPTDVPLPSRRRARGARDCVSGPLRISSVPPGVKATSSVGDGTLTDRVRGAYPGVEAERVGAGAEGRHFAAAVAVEGQRSGEDLGPRPVLARAKRPRRGTP